ncbi:unnamed protein product [Prorocentrum cordatum]|uniref:BSD domain-containing protein n=1 Tax=Prorocentrum cordatum TaxID=2364126 RepID=A0ABN9X7V6_9DINO|nr:unnamed protein product [Polarella glacialis]
MGQQLPSAADAAASFAAGVAAATGGGEAHDEVELRCPEEVGGRARFSRPYPWVDLVARAAHALALRPLAASSGSSPEWEPSEDEALQVLERAEPRLRALSEGPGEFLAGCPPRDGAVDGAAMVTLAWTEALLEQLPDLRQTRYRLVPGRLSEEAFWSRYFGAVFEVLEEELAALRWAGLASLFHASRCPELPPCPACPGAPPSPGRPNLSGPEVQWAAALAGFGEAATSKSPRWMAAAQAVVPLQAAELQEWAFVLYAVPGPPVYHQRQVVGCRRSECSATELDAVLIGTPDLDVYEEDYRPSSMGTDIVRVVFSPARWPPPAGVPRAQVNRFRDDLTGLELAAMQGAARDLEGLAVYGDMLEVGSPGGPSLAGGTGRRQVVTLPSGHSVFAALVADSEVAQLKREFRGSDARSLPVVRTAVGRERPWTSVVNDCAEEQIPDLGQEDGRPVLHSEIWNGCRCLQGSDFGVAEHESLSKIVETLGAVDQLDIYNLAGVEVAYWKMQMIECYGDERRQEQHSTNGKLPLDEVQAFLGGGRAPSMVCPDLLDQALNQMHAGEDDLFRRPLDKPCRVQGLALDHLSDCCARFRAPPPVLAADAALRGLQVSSAYGADESLTLAPLSFDLVSLPKAGARPRPLEELSGRDGPRLLEVFLGSKALEAPVVDMGVVAPGVQEVSREVLNGRCQVVSSGGWARPEHIVVHEGRALVHATRRALRDSRAFGKRVLFQTDALSSVLALTKGRSSFRGLLRVSRQWAAWCLAGRVAPALRLLPSERRPADAPSRRDIPIGVWLDFACDAKGASAALARGAPAKRRKLSSSQAEPRPLPEHAGRQVRARRRRAAERAREAPPPGRSRLQERSVTPKTLATYRAAWRRFEVWRADSLEAEAVALRRRVLASAPLVELLDDWLTLWMDAEYLGGEPAHPGSPMLAVAKFHLPEFGRGGAGGLPKAVQALRGWRRPALGRTRLPLPWEVVALLATQLVRDGF